MSQPWYSRIAVSVSKRSDSREGNHGISEILGTLGILGTHIRKTPYKVGRLWVVSKLQTALGKFGEFWAHIAFFP